MSANHLVISSQKKSVLIQVGDQNAAAQLQWEILRVGVVGNGFFFSAVKSTEKHGTCSELMEHLMISLVFTACELEKHLFWSCIPL